MRDAVPEQCVCGDPGAALIERYAVDSTDPSFANPTGEWVWWCVSCAVTELEA